MFHPVYKGEPLFGDSSQFLNDYNFDLVDLKMFPEFHPMRGKHGFRGRGSNLDGEALFVKRVESIDGNDTALKLNKQAFIATAFGQFEITQRCVEDDRFKKFDKKSGHNSQYLEFISRLTDVVAALPQRPSPLFSDSYSYEQSEYRFKYVQKKIDGDDSIRTFLVKWFMKGFRKANCSAYMFKIFRAKAGRVLWKFGIRLAPIEILLREYHMEDQFHWAYANRVDDEAREKMLRSS